MPEPILMYATPPIEHRVSDLGTSTMRTFLFPTTTVLVLIFTGGVIAWIADEITSSSLLGLHPVISPSALTPISIWPPLALAKPHISLAMSFVGFSFEFYSFVLPFFYQHYELIHVHIYC